MTAKSFLHKALSSLLVCCAVTLAVADTPEGGESLLPADLEIWQPVRDTVTLETLTPEAAGTDRAGWRVRASDSTLGAEPARAMVSIAEPLSKGDIMLLTLWLQAEVGEQAVIGFGPAHHAAAPRKTWSWAAADSDWQKITIPFSTERRYAAGEAGLTLWLGSATGAVNVADAALTRYGSSIEMVDLIETTCRGPLTVVVKDAEGNAVEGVAVELGQTHSALGVPVDPQHPPYEGLATGEGGYGVPHMIALRSLDGGKVAIDDLPDSARVITLKPSVARNPGRFPFSGIPTRLRGLQAVSVERGNQDVPGRGYSLTVDRPVEAYLFVEHLGEPDLGSGWRPTAMQATWGTTDWQVTDRVFTQRFDAGRIMVAPHTGSDEPWWTRTQGVTDADGRFTVPAYHGRYRLTVRYHDQSHETDATFSDTTGEVVVELR